MLRSLGAHLKKPRPRYNAALIEEYPLKVGDVIRSSSGKIARVENVFVKWDSIKVFAVLRNADGNFGKRAASMWAREWEKPEKIEL